MASVTWSVECRATYSRKASLKSKPGKPLAAELLRLGTYSVGEVAGQLGFSSPFNFSRTFRRVMGMAPSKVGHRIDPLLDDPDRGIQGSFRFAWATPG